MSYSSLIKPVLTTFVNIRGIRGKILLIREVRGKKTEGSHA